MVRIYVRIPRNRWASIGEIDLDGYLAVYGERKGGPVFIDEDILSAIKKTTRLTRQIHAYEEKHFRSLLLVDLNEFWGWGRKDVRRHIKHLRALWQQWEKISPYRLLAKTKTMLLPEWAMRKRQYYGEVLMPEKPRDRKHGVA